MSIDEKEFAVPFFRENGFTRRQCIACKSYFWSQIPERKTCGDVPCEDYDFIGKPPTRGRFTVPQIREMFIRFFEKNGHTPVRPYPVVARWRDDVYLVGASIYDFQPFVTEGVIPPPANPLVVSQPSLRFTDIDNVGPTAGRHLLIFEMGGAHAFNSKQREVYWIDDTIRYHHELATGGLGVKSESLTYKEHFWSGGGNAGPDVEACVAGLEISTLVFMRYKVVDDQLIELPIRTVDTGYGIERWAWLSEGSPSCFHVVYGPILEKIMRLGGVKFDPKLASASARLSGFMDIEKTDDRVKARKRVAQQMGIGYAELERALVPVESAYAVADHTKAIAFLLAEGVVPSNVREGYLTRLLIRRTYRMLRMLGIEDRLPEVVEAQIEFWGGDFPNLREMRVEILEALEAEQEKYRRTLERGAEIVRRLSSDLKAKGRHDLPLEQLVELYDSQGLVPDIVKEAADKEGIRVEVPGNFFSFVSARHLTGQAEVKSDLAEELKDSAAKFPATKPLYYENSNQREFEAKVLGVVGDGFTILDQTCFYPEGGGQPGDFGSLTTHSGSVKVVDSQKIGNVILHRLDGPTPRPGETVKGQIDWERRASLMRHHTGTHVLMGAVRRVLGEHAWQAGAQKDVERSRLDISHYRRITDDELRRIEELATETVLKNIPVEISWMPREKAEQTYGFRLYQGGVVPGREVRVVKIGDWDVEACGGTHCTRTGDIGIIKIVRSERIQDGVERLIFSSGTAALREFQQAENVLQRTAELLQSPPEKTDAQVGALLEEKALLAKRLEEANIRLAEIESAELISKSKNLGKLRLAVIRKGEAPEEQLTMLASKIVEKAPDSVAVIFSVGKSARVFVSSGKQAIAKGAHAGKIAEALAKVIGGGGGGKNYFGQGGGTRVEKTEEALASAEKIVRETIASK